MECRNLSGRGRLPLRRCDTAFARLRLKILLAAAMQTNKRFSFAKKNQKTLIQISASPPDARPAAEWSAAQARHRAGARAPAGAHPSA
jgi:hypothetical protein